MTPETTPKPAYIETWPPTHFAFVTDTEIQQLQEVTHTVFLVFTGTFDPNLEQRPGLLTTTVLLRSGEDIQAVQHIIGERLVPYTHTPPVSN